MTNKTVRRGIPVILLVFGMMLLGCGNGTTDGGFVAVTDITNLPEMAIVDSALPLAGVVLPSNAANRTIAWSGDDVTNGVFNAASTGLKTVTAKISNGKTESTPFIKTFNIMVYDNTSANQIEKAQDTWIRGDDTFTVSGITWTFKMDGILVAEGIIINATGSRYRVQVNQAMWSDGNLHTDYSIDEGDYSFTNSYNTLTITPDRPSNNVPVKGEWTRQGE